MANVVTLPRFYERKEIKMTKIFIAIANHYSDVDTSSHVIGVFSTKALAIRAAVKAWREDAFFGWHIKESQLDSTSSNIIKLSEGEIESALIGCENV